MKIKFRIHEKNVVYTDEELELLPRSELKQIVRDIQLNIDEVSMRRTNYNMHNGEKYNSKEYLKKTLMYKQIIINLKKQIEFVNKIIERNKRDELHDMEHWLYNFYINTKKSVRKGKLKKLIKLTDDTTKYHINFGE